MGMTQIGAGLAPVHGGAPTVAHHRLLATGMPADVIASMPAAGAAMALSQLAKGASLCEAAKAGMPAQAQRHMTGAPMEVLLAGNGAREFPMGFGLTPVAAGANVLITANPQVNYRPSRLVIPDTVAPSFMINDFKIGMRSQLVAPGALPAQSFTQQAVGTAMSLDTVNVGQFVTLDVTNVSTQAANFAASLFGTTLNS